MEATHEGLRIIPLTLSDAVVRHEGNNAARVDRTIPGGLRLTRVFGKQGTDSAIVEPSVREQKAAYSPLALEAEGPGDLP